MAERLPGMCEDLNAILHCTKEKGSTKSTKTTCLKRTVCTYQFKKQILNNRLSKSQPKAKVIVPTARR